MQIKSILKKTIFVSHVHQSVGTTVFRGQLAKFRGSPRCPVYYVQGVMAGHENSWFSHKAIVG